MTSNDEPLKERRIFFTEEELADKPDVPEELQNHTIKQLQGECRRKVIRFALLALFCAAGAGFSAYTTYKQSKSHEAEVKHFEGLIEDHKKEAIKRENELIKELYKAKAESVVSKKTLNTNLRLQNTQLRFIEDAVNCELRNRTFNKKGRCLQKAIRKRMMIRN